MKPPIIAFYGPQRCGKSEATKALPNWKRHSFAGPIYEMMSALLGTEARDLPKERAIPQLGGRTLRYALQTLGTEWGREMIDGDLWLNTLRSRLVDGQYAIVDDLRFWNEFEMLRDIGATIIRIDRPGLAASEDTHASERDLDQFVPDLILTNAGTADEFHATVRAAVGNFFGIPLLTL